MKLVYVKIRDPIQWYGEQPDRFYEEDLEKITPATIRVAGLLVKETDEYIIIGEMNLEEDNPTLAKLGLKYPYYRNIVLILKTNIPERKEYEV